MNDSNELEITKQEKKIVKKFLMSGASKWGIAALSLDVLAFVLWDDLPPRFDGFILGLGIGATATTAFVSTKATKNLVQDIFEEEQKDKCSGCPLSGTEECVSERQKAVKNNTHMQVLLRNTASLGYIAMGHVLHKVGSDIVEFSVNLDSALCNDSNLNSKEAAWEIVSPLANSGSGLFKKGDALMSKGAKKVSANFCGKMAEL